MAPLAALFTQTATAWTAAVAPRERWHGLAVYGLDGTTLRIPDTPENVTAFGRPPSPDGAGAGYPHSKGRIALHPSQPSARRVYPPAALP